MKMTMHIDEELLKRVMDHHEFESKTEAVDFALREIDRKAKLRAYAKSGLGMTAEELKASVYSDYDVVALRVAEVPPGYGKHARSEAAVKAQEATRKPVRYGKRGSRR